jgi:hypothetical protein
MASGARAGSALRRAAVDFGVAAGRPPIVSPQDSRKAAGANDAGAGACPEIACLRHLLPVDVLAAARNRAGAVGVGADRVLLAGGAIGEEEYLRALGASLGVGFEPLDGLPRRLCPIDDGRLIETAAQGMLPVRENDDLTLVLAPRGTAARYIAQLIEANPAQARHFRFTSAERLNRFVLRHAGKALAARATGRLQQQWPALSAAPAQRRPGMALAALALAAGTLLLTPATARQGLALALAGLFLAWLGLPRRRG